MFRKIIIFTLFLISTNIGMAISGTVQLPQTGQATCYDSSGVVKSCSGTGQDGDIKAGVAWPNPRFTVSGDCVSDNLTGLMWAKNGNRLNGTKSWQIALDFANGLSLCGYSDWRLPNVNELESLVNYDQSNSATWLNTQGFTNVQSEHYWSSSRDFSGSVWASCGDGSAWIVHMRSGVMSTDAWCDYLQNFVWPVRSGN
jgi:hypothetical protein